jgi:endonuclease YncB( thermonuclease family)
MLRHSLYAFALIAFALQAQPASAQMQAPAMPSSPAARAPAIAPPDEAPDIAPQVPSASRLPERIIRPMRAVDPMTLRAEGSVIRLWGIKPAQTAETPLELKALDLMDKLIQEQQVNCKIEGGTRLDLVARCTTAANQDLALELLRNGYVVVDRRQTYNSVFASNYEKEQEAARVAQRGVWALVKEDQNEKGATGMPKWLEPHISYLLPLALIFGPFGGLAVVAVIMWYWLKRMAQAQEQEAEQSNRKEAMLINRERQVLISTLEGELTENKNKIEAFLVIYGDMLRGLQDSNEVPKYQQGGDIVQKHPTFGRAVFEANVSKLSLLDIKLAGQISKLYAAMPKEQEYINLEPTVPLETAVKLVEKVLKEAEQLLEPINGVVLGLQASQQKKSAVSAATAPPVAA